MWSGEVESDRASDPSSGWDSAETRTGWQHVHETVLTGQAPQDPGVQPWSLSPGSRHSQVTTAHIEVEGDKLQVTNVLPTILKTETSRKTAAMNSQQCQNNCKMITKSAKIPHEPSPTKSQLSCVSLLLLWSQTSNPNLMYCQSSLAQMSDAATVLI